MGIHNKIVKFLVVLVLLSSFTTVKPICVSYIQLASPPLIMASPTTPCLYICTAHVIRSSRLIYTHIDINFSVTVSGIQKTPCGGGHLSSLMGTFVLAGLLPSWLSWRVLFWQAYCLLDRVFSFVSVGLLALWPL